MGSALVLGAGGFIGSHLVKKLKKEGYRVRGVDLKYPEFSPSEADEFIIGDLRENCVVKKIMYLSVEETFDEVYQLAADMGGAGFVFSGMNDAEIMHNSALINLNVAEWAVKYKVKKIFYSSSACIYPEYNQMNPDNPKCSEDSAYPAMPDSEYGWEKMFSERMFFAFARNHGLNIRIARFHNIFGPEGVYDGGREKAPAAICRKVLRADQTGEIEIWGDGRQTRSFLYIDECLEGVRRLMSSGFQGPVNIGSDEMITINKLVEMVIGFSGKDLKVKHIDGPLGVRGRNSDNHLIKEKLGWSPSMKLSDGMKQTYDWIKKEIEQDQPLK
ncbi:MAG: NAD-dependent epimerase/dehydratase family protein [Candidatus Delongbacteria bacterium]